MANNNENLVVRLYGAVTELEMAIGRARTSMSQMQNIPGGVIERLSSYDSVLTSQRKYIHELSAHVEHENVTEINRLVTLINQLSSMIRDDVKSVLISISAQGAKPRYEDESNFC